MRVSAVEALLHDLVGFVPFELTGGLTRLFFGLFEFGGSNLHTGSSFFVRHDF